MNKLEKYIQFTLLKAVKLSPDDSLVIWCSKQQADFAKAVAAFAKNHSICHTEIFYVEDIVENTVPEDKTKMWKDNGYKLLWLYSDSCTAMPPVSWITVNVATESWAKQVFPKIKDCKLAVEKLWEAIFTACRIDDNDPIENWDKHIKNLNDTAEMLNKYNFDKLVFKNSLGTDFSVNLIKNHRWINCTSVNHRGETIITNIPTEEVFTAPDAATANGIVYATKPLLYEGKVIDKFYLEFKNGKVIGCGAQQNADMLKKLLASCKNSDRIGEIAIVPHSSPLSQLDIFWYDTSFDENAGCHMALGFAYPQNLQDYSTKNSNDLEILGFNRCDIHEDFVIGSSDMEITGITAGGAAVTVLKNGEWNI